MKEVLSRQEWVIMETLWNRNPLFLSEIMEAMSPVIGWNSSSYLTYLKRMADKGYLSFKTVSGNRRYFPLIQRESCIENESSYILSKLTESSAKMLLVSMIQKSGLAADDCEELKKLISSLTQDQKQGD